jgi:hypothetical protein
MDGLQHGFNNLGMVRGHFFANVGVQMLVVKDVSWHVFCSVFLNTVIYGKRHHPTVPAVQDLPVFDAFAVIQDRAALWF